MKNSINKNKTAVNEQLIKFCPICNRTLFKGTQRQAKGQIIYCDECATKAEPLKKSKKIKKYLLLGVYKPVNPKNKIISIHASDNIKELQNIWKTIDEFYLEIGETFDVSLSKKALSMIEKNNYLNELFEIFHGTILWTIDVLGIFKTEPVLSDLSKYPGLRNI